MAQATFLELTNRILVPFNEVPLDSSTFASATGFYAEAKADIQQALFDVYTYQDNEWPFLWQNFTFTTVAGTTDYSKDTSAISIDWDNIRIARDAINNIPQTKLVQIGYDKYIDELADNDANMDTDGYGVPSYIVRKPDNNFILSTVPDRVYTIKYNGFVLPSAPQLYTDTTVIPEAFEQVVIDKALHYAYMFRDNMEQANTAQQRYEANIGKMRRILIPQDSFARLG